MQNKYKAIQSEQDSVSSDKMARIDANAEAANAPAIHCCEARLSIDTCQMSNDTSSVTPPQNAPLATESPKPVRCSAWLGHMYKDQNNLHIEVLGDKTSYISIPIKTIQMVINSSEQEINNEYVLSQ